MKHLLKIAEKLDGSGEYILSDKLFKISQQIMDISQYADNPYTPKEIMDIRKQLVPADFIGQIYQDKKGDNLLSTSDPKSFSISLLEYARINKFPNLQAAFDDYANNGAAYRGQRISQVPELQELYKRISQNPGAISKQMVEQEIRNIVTQRLGLWGSQTESRAPVYTSQIDPNTGADIGFLENEYRQNIYEGDPKSLPNIRSEIENDKYLPEKSKQTLLDEFYRQVETLR